MPVYEGTRAAWWNGVRLWEHAEPPVPSAERTEARHTGATRTWGLEKTASPNWFRSVEVATAIEPLQSPQVTDLEAETALAALLMQLDDALIGKSTEQATLAYAQAEEAKAEITGGPYAAAGNVDHAAPGNGWVPASGEYVLLRNASSETAFLATITGIIDSDTVTLAAAGDDDWQSIDANWTMHYVQIAASLCTFKRMSPGTRAGLSKNAYRTGVSFLFSHHGVWLFALKHSMERGA